MCWHWRLKNTWNMGPTVIVVVGRRSLVFVCVSSSAGLVLVFVFSSSSSDGRVLICISLASSCARRLRVVGSIGRLLLVIVCWLSSVRHRFLVVVVPCSSPASRISNTTIVVYCFLFSSRLWRCGGVGLVVVMVVCGCGGCKCLTTPFVSSNCWVVVTGVVAVVVVALVVLPLLLVKLSVARAARHVGYGDYCYEQGWDIRFYEAHNPQIACSKKCFRTACQNLHARTARRLQ